MELREYEKLRKTVTTEHGELGYAEAGEGPPALFVHGLFVTGYLWRDVIAALADQRRCIAYDLPGHGRSKVDEGQDLSLDAQAEMLAAFCDALGLDSVDLVGNDTGGAIVQVFAARHPERVRSMTLINCEARDVLPSPAPIAQLIGEVAAKGEFAPAAVVLLEDHDAARGDAGLGVAFEDPGHLSADDIRGYLEDHYSSLENARVVERTVLALNADQLRAVEPDLRKLDTPTLAVWGTGDDIFDVELAYWLRDAIPGCEEVVEVEGGKLFWPGERPDDLVPHLRRFWAAAVERQGAVRASG